MEDLQTLKKEENNHILQVLEGEYKTTTVNRLEELQDNTDYTITHIKTILYRGIDRYIFRIKEDNKIYISNYFLEKQIKEKNLPKEIFTFTTTRIRTTPTKKREKHIIF